MDRIMENYKTMKMNRWTRESVAEAMRTCRSRKEFRRRYGGAAAALLRNGWQDLFDECLPIQALPAPWTEASIAEAMRSCHSRNEFKKRYSGAVDAIRHHHWQYLYNENIPARIHAKWTRESIADDIAECTSIYQVRTQHQSAYGAIQRNGWDDLLSGLPQFPAICNEPPVWSVYRWEFVEPHAVYIGLTNNYRRRIGEELKNSHASPVHDFIERTGCCYTVTEIHGSLSSSKAAELEIAYIAKYRALGYKVLNRNRGGTLGGYVRGGSSISDEELLERIFTQFSAYSELRKNGGSLLRMACERGLKDAILKVMPKQENLPKYKRDELAQLCSSYADRKTLRKEHPKEYSYMLDHKYHDLLPPAPCRERAQEPEIPEAEVRELAGRIVNGELTSREAGKPFGISAFRFNRIAESMGIGVRREPGVKGRPRTYTDEALLYEVTSRCRTLADLRADTALLAIVKRRGLYSKVSSMLEHSRRQSVTRDDALLAVSRCPRLVDFANKFPSEYTACRNNGWDDILAMCVRTYRPSDTVSDEEIRSAVAQCKTRTEFNKRFHREAYAARKRGIYNAVVSVL